MNEPLPGFCGKRFLTTYLTITGFGAHGNSGDESSKELLFWNKRCQKGAENVRKKFRQLFGTRMPRVRVSPLGPNKDAIIDTKRINDCVLDFYSFSRFCMVCSNYFTENTARGLTHPAVFRPPNSPCAVASSFEIVLLPW